MQLSLLCQCSRVLRALQLTLAWLTASSVSGAPPITSVAFAPDGQHVLVGSQAGIKVHSWPDMQTIEKTIPTELVHVHDLAFSADGQWLLAAGGAPAESGSVEVLSWPEAKLVHRIAKHDDVVYRVAWSPGGKQWASAGADGVCQVFDSDTGAVLTGYAGHSRAVLAVCYLPDGQTIASAGVDQTIQLWNSQTGVHLRTLDNHLAAVNDLAIRPAPTTAHNPNRSAGSLPMLASVSDDQTVRLWQPTIGRLVRFARLPSIAQTVIWTPKGDRILVGCHDGTLRAIAPDPAAISQELSGPEQRIYAIAVEPGGSHILAAGSTGATRIFLPSSAISASPR